jgi:iron complex outermembrane receptor protein
MKHAPLALAISLALVPVVATAQQPRMVLEEVIVTAQKREETLTSAPVAVTAVSSQQIQDFSIFQADELNKLVTGMEVRYEGDSNVGVGLRGVGTFQQGSNPSRVGTYMDDFWMASQAGFALASMFDMASVQILKGPQGTLYGQPSPAGAMILTTQDPNFDGINGHIQGSYLGDPEGYNIQGAINFPITDTFAVRLAGLSDDRETGVENIVRDLDEERNRDGVRFKALWEPTDNFSAKLGYTYMESNDSETYRVVETIDSSLGNFNVDADDLNAIADARSEVTEKEDTLGTLHLKWLVGDVEVKWFSGFLDAKISSVTDEDNTDLPDTNVTLDTHYGDDYDSNQHELRISGSAFDNWEWTVGAYYGEAFSQTDVLTDVNQAAFGGVFRLTLDIPIDSEVKAVFTHNTISLTDDTELTLGLRYNEFDQSTSNTINGDFWIGSQMLPGGEITDPAFIFPGAFPCPDGAAPPCFIGEEDEQEEWTGTVKLSHFFSDELNVYATVDRGYRPGAPNFDLDGVFSPEFTTFDGEDVDSFEIGAKGDLFDGRARYTTAFFYSVYDDYQVPVNFEAYNTVTGAVQTITNAPFVNVEEAEQIGVEGDFRMMVTDRWMVYGGVTYSQVEFTDGEVPCTDPSQPAVGPDNRFNTCDADGEVASSMPEWTAVLQTEYTWPQLVAGSDVSINALWSYKGETEGVGDTTGRLDGDSFAVLDLYANLRNETWSLQAFVKNVLDEDGVLNKRPLNDPAYNELTVTPPLTWGITASYNFGM